MNIVWFKRDLRIEDHAPLLLASQKGPVIPLYILEPDLWKEPDLSYRQYIFLKESLLSLQVSLKNIGSSLTIKVGPATSIFETFIKRHSAITIWSHQETWNLWTYKRDIALRSLFKQYHIQWNEIPQHGVIRRLSDRDGWSKKWYNMMSQPVLSPLKHLQSPTLYSEPIPEAVTLGLSDPGYTQQQVGGRPQGLNYLDTFFNARGKNYTTAMSSPLHAFTSCSRLSPYLAFGCLSIKEVFQRGQKDLHTVTHSTLPKDEKKDWLQSIRSLLKRLRWHCHFIQKLEDSPSIEYRNMHHAYDTYREKTLNTHYLTAWEEGRTGYPMVDACMRALKSTGWINFRMRAMLMSFCSYHLWLHWKIPALFLAKQFVDYEPGIHYSQVQMQSGTTGINTLRIYNPIKQGLDHDPNGDFVRQWIPEIAHLPGPTIHTPWEYPLLRNAAYPDPIIDEKIARKKSSRYFI
tara:strand:+ start:8330 stop:9709 length:1380 start_codon:yes stop_codon:yes gene_type:complete